MSKLYIAVLCFALLALAACSDNLFGSGGNDCGDDIKCWRLKAENEFRNGNYEASHKSYGEILKLDSTASVGYFGMAKAGLWMKDINPFDVFRYVDADDDKIPFVSDSIIIRNRYLQGMRAAAIPLSKLKRRDSLTILYELHQKNDPANRSDSLSEFRREFCGNSKTGACYDKTKTPQEPFPLSDREYKYNSYYSGLLISTMAKTLLEFFDTNKDGCIARRGKKKLDNPGDPQKDADEWKKWGCERKGGKFDYDLSVHLIKDSTGSFSIDWSQAFEEAELDSFYLEQIKNPYTDLPPEIEDINKRIDEFNGDMNDVVGILNMNSDGTGESWQDELGKYKDFATFYKVSTRIDEDGDGCIDEELLNKQDNDGDGAKGENARLASLDPDSPLWGRAATNHGMFSDRGFPPDSQIYYTDPRNLPIKLNETPYYIDNKPDGSKKTELLGDSNGVVTVIAFTQIPGYWTTDSLELKLAVAQDTVCGKLNFSLKERKELIGGCWPNYNEEIFVEYWLKRKLARPAERMGRVHPDCLSCVGNACSKLK